jgi:hypothetical protein
MKLSGLLTPPEVVTVTGRLPPPADWAIASVAIICVESMTFTLLTVTSVPPTCSAVDPLLKPEPTTVTWTCVPAFPQAGVMEVSAGGVPDEEAILKTKASP